ncbi:MAG: long-chain fatty acid--CoA ligase [Chlamydiales bacterium]|nr:long-chain fatty acid--CoA ligase [Chlamydiales bacterium]
MKPFDTFSDMLRHIESNFSNPKALNYQDPQGAWRSESTETYIEKVKFLALGLIKRGLKAGERVGIMSKPCPGWTIADLAIVMAGGVVVPLFGNLSSENLTYQVEQTGIKTLFVAGEQEWMKCLRFRDLFPQIISLDPDHDEAGAISLREVLEAGEKYERTKPDLWFQLVDAAKPDSIATIIYTSGSTGRPKGVQLTQRNLVGLINQDPFNWNPTGDRYLSFLPLAHIFARALNFIILQSGMSIYYLEDPKALVPACYQVRPTVMVLVPRLLEKFKSKLVLRIHETGWILGRIGGWALRLAEKENDNWWIRAQRWLADKLIYGSFRKVFGGSVRLIASGGAKLNPSLYAFFVNMGFPLYEGWGMTEACPISCNNLAGRKIGSVGRPFEGIEVRVGENNELQVRGVIVTPGYYQNDAETEKALDSEGWLHTGDQGSIDEDGFITIIGRVKDLLKTSTGEWVAPLPIEQELSKLNLVDQAIVIAEGHSYCTCLLFPDHEALFGLKAAYAMSELSDEAFLDRPEIQEEISRHIRLINHRLNHWEEIHDYRFVLDPLTIEGGDLTPTLKVRRNVLTEKYADIINAMYQGAHKL